MYLHIGNARIVFDKDIIGIFDSALLDLESNKLLNERKKEDFAACSSSGSRGKSFIITDGRIFYSPISPITLARRGNSKK